ncbi:MAG: CPBP family intramembrane metalloprotease [Candidatus Eremiobacteraeota bacterium]|nr:CPBP family intramembrane metalloprotease [Candidatus Eremiobacteraeota bacterium]
MNDSTSTISPAWPTRWPKNSFTSPWTWVLAGFVAGIFLFAFVLGLKTSGAKLPAISPLFIDIAILLQGILEGLLVACVLLAVPRLSKFSLRELGFRAPTGPSIALALGGSIVMVIVANGGASLIDYLVHSSHEQDVVEIFKSLHDPASVALFVTFAVLFAPFAEESLFRVFFFNLGLRYGGFWAGAILSGVLFGIAHGDLIAALPLALGGIVLCYVYYRTRNAFASMISHGIFNGLSIAALMISNHATK